MVLCTLPLRHIPSHKMFSWNLKIKKQNYLIASEGSKSVLLSVWPHLDSAGERLSTLAWPVSLSRGIFFFSNFTFVGQHNSLWVSLFPNHGTWTVQEWRDQGEHRQAPGHRFSPAWAACDFGVPAALMSLLWWAIAWSCELQQTLSLLSCLLSGCLITTIEWN